MLSPAYDLVATAPYRHMGEGPQTLGLKFGGSHQFGDVRVSTFERLEARIGASSAQLEDAVVDVIQRVGAAWLEHEEILASAPSIRDAIGESIRRNSRTLLGRSTV